MFDRAYYHFKAERIYQTAHDDACMLSFDTVVGLDCDFFCAHAGVCY